MSAPQRPHILLITIDQHRFDVLGINGNPVLRPPMSRKMEWAKELEYHPKTLTPCENRLPQVFVPD